jgi:hypothetical protein
MIRKIRGLYTRITARIIPAAEVNEKEMNARTIVHRRVEVIVERESVSIRIPGQAAQGASGAASEAPGEPPPPPRSLKP